MTFIKSGLTKKILTWMLPLLVIGGGLVISSLIRNSRPEVPIVKPVKPVATIRGITAKKTSFHPVINAQGTVRAKRQIEFVPEVAGKIIWISPSFAQGGMFRAGDILVRIDPRNYEFAVSRAEASVADARNSLTLELAEAELARAEWEDLGNGEPTALVLREPQLQSVRAKLASAEADLERALLDLERTILKAPFDGRLEEKNVDIGQYVSLGKKLAVLYSTDIAEISLPLTDRELGKLDFQLIYSAKGEKHGALTVELFANVGGKRRSWTGRVVRTAGTVDVNSRVLSIIVEVDNPYSVKPGGAPLLNGLFVEVEIPGKEMKDVFLLPRSALHNQSQVVVVDENDTLRSRDIEIIHSTPRQIIVRGLKDGEHINISPLEILIEGTKVKWQHVDGDVP
ncbi:Membrane fusion protein of RND family multidrug efflux pump [hydrothermal vent metagenome]|uniref:Membrane fusion protein of RND family multidrug efflux pump n=1 Tax=hydrothermal vent metagenome TaxID=652676 RepID=A0A3B0T5K8_9ZZZZ